MFSSPPNLFCVTCFNADNGSMKHGKFLLKDGENFFPFITVSYVPTPAPTSEFETKKMLEGIGIPSIKSQRLRVNQWTIWAELTRSNTNACPTKTATLNYTLVSLSQEQISWNSV